MRIRGTFYDEKTQPYRVKARCNTLPILVALVASDKPPGIARSPRYPRPAKSVISWKSN